MAAHVDEVAVFAEGIWLRSQMECVEFETKHITDVQFQWFTDIVSYLHVVTGEAVSTAESQRDAVHAEKGRKKFDISAFKTDVPMVLGGFSKGKESTTTLTEIRTTECGTLTME